MIEHSTVEVNGARLHLARAGRGRPLLLHGWPEFWLTWEPVTARLPDHFRLLAPDLHGFGDTEKPSGLLARMNRRMTYWPFSTISNLTASALLETILARGHLSSCANAARSRRGSFSSSTSSIRALMLAKQ